MKPRNFHTNWELNLKETFNSGILKALKAPVLNLGKKVTADHQSVYDHWASCLQNIYQIYFQYNITN